MEPEGGDVLREAVWNSKEDKPSDNEQYAKARTYLSRMVDALHDMGFSLPYSPFGESHNKMFVYGGKVKDRYPHDDYYSEIRVYVPATERLNNTVTCIVMDDVRLHFTNSRVEECIAGHTKYTTTFSLDICRAMEEEDFLQFLKAIRDIKEGRRNISSTNHILGNDFDPDLFGCCKNDIVKNSDSELVDAK